MLQGFIHSICRYFIVENDVFPYFLKIYTHIKVIVKTNKDEFITGFSLNN